MDAYILIIIVLTGLTSQKVWRLGLTLVHEGSPGPRGGSSGWQSRRDGCHAQAPV